jgi:hypothetical protein
MTHNLVLLVNTNPSVVLNTVIEDNQSNQLYYDFQLKVKQLLDPINDQPWRTGLYPDEATKRSMHYKWIDAGIVKI